MGSFFTYITPLNRFFFLNIQSMKIDKAMIIDYN